MFCTRKFSVLLAVAACAGLVVAGCSSQGGAAAQDQANQVSAGKAGTPRMKIAMVTHAVPGDTFWDIVRKGAEAAAAKDNVDLVYTHDPDGSKQANLVVSAVNQKVDGIAVTLAKPDAMLPAVQQARKAGIPVVAFNSGFSDWQRVGAMEYIGQDEKLAGEAAGRRLNSEGAKHVICVNQEQGHVGLEARCAGLQQAFKGKSQELFVNGADMASVLATITAKLQQDPSIDYVVTLGAPFALTAVKAVANANSKAKVATFDTNSQLIGSIDSGDVQWAIDQQPYLQGYEAVDTLWLYKTNGDILGGGQPVLTGPSFIDKSNVGKIAKYAERGTR